MMNFGMILLGFALIMIGTSKTNLIIGLGIKGFATSFYYIPFIPLVLKKITA